MQLIYLDEMTISAVPPGHYAEVAMVPVEKELIKMTEAGKRNQVRLWNWYNFESN